MSPRNRSRMLTAHASRAGLLRRSAGRAVFGAALVAGVLAWSAAPASAHNYVVDLGPADGSVVTAQPESIFVTTSDALLDLDGSGASSGIQVSGPSDAPLYFGDGCVTVAGATAQTTAQLGAAGEYTVTWQVVSTDGHPISDNFSFDWQPGADVALAEGSATPPDCGGTVAETDSGVADTGADGADATSSDPTASDGVSDTVWIVSALAAVGLAVTVVLLVVRRRS